MSYIPPTQVVGNRGVKYIKITNATTIVYDWASDVEFYKFRRCVCSNSEALAVGRLNINVQIPLLHKE